MNDPGRFDEEALSQLGSAELEVMRLQLLRDRDPRLDGVLDHIVARGINAIERAVERRGGAAQLPHQAQVAAIRDANARFMVALRRNDQLPTAETLAEQLAAQCVDAQSPKTSRPRLAPHTPSLQLVNEQLGEWLRRRRRGPGDGRNGGTHA